MISWFSRTLGKPGKAGIQQPDQIPGDWVGAQVGVVLGATGGENKREDGSMIGSVAKHGDSLAYIKMPQPMAEQS